MLPTFLMLAPAFFTSLNSKRSRLFQHLKNVKENFKAHLISSHLAKRKLYLPSTTGIARMSTAAVSNTTIPPDDEEIALSKLVFGDTADFYEALARVDIGQDEDLSDGEDVDMIEASSGDEGASDDDDLNRVHDDQLFFVDDGENLDDPPIEKGVSDMESDSDSSSEAAWSDSEDERISFAISSSNKTKKLRKSYVESTLNGKEYVMRLRSQFEKIFPRPKWADDSGDEHSPSDVGSDDEESDQVINGDVHALSKILQSTSAYKDVSTVVLAPKILDITRLKDANSQRPSHSGIQSLSFHPSKPLLLSGGYDRTLRIYHIDGKNNHLVTSVYLTGTPVQTCTFYVSPSQTEQKVFSAGRRRYMHSWDISNASSQYAKIEKISRLYGHEQTQRSFEKFKVGHLYTPESGLHGIIFLQGNNGWINILHATTGVWLAGCKIEGVLADFCIDYIPLKMGKFRTILIVVNSYGQVWEFDVSNKAQVLKKWEDSGSVGITTIQVGGGTSSAQLSPFNEVRPNRWLAIGSESGFVHVYDRNSSSNKLSFALDQLTTSISSLAFSFDGQIMCMASRASKDALRLVHLPSGTVFSNWPTSGTPLGKVTSVAFSPRGGFLAVGNEQGKVRLWKLNHYT
ncbi:LAMI_0H10924g1_1 [Lachancea mirantina]|uniref:LAMI_0H10924g1_1 n=1 Tax=Lachancea mirantina TaxID=1230905 RepID=A0A1G4KHB6_9SACH|nr:LAMI_0H10924g1_1 [Lachancea mirantina]